MKAAFPNVSLVRNIPHRDHPLGRYLKGSRTIQLASDELKKHDEEIRRFAVFHEIGHFWSVSVLGGETNTEDEEAFADAFATYFLSPSSLTGPWSAFLSTKCFEANDAEHVEEFAEGIIKNLEKAIWKV